MLSIFFFKVVFLVGGGGLGFCSNSLKYIFVMLSRSRSTKVDAWVDAEGELEGLDTPYKITNGYLCP